MEGLETRHYKDYIGKKGIKDRMEMTLQNLEIYGYIGSKTKSY